MADINWILFIVASVAIILTPGQDLVLVMSRSLSHGTIAGVLTAAGVSSGLLAHTVLATLGVGTLIQASEVLFTAMKIVGAAYLLYLGVSLLRSNHGDLTGNSSTIRSPGKLYLDGALSNVANPKIAIFYFAFLPQFVTPGASNPTASVFILGASFAMLTFLIKGPIALLAGKLSQLVADNPIYLKSIFKLSGVTLIALGFKLALESRS